MGLFTIFSKPKLNKHGWKPDLPDHRDRLMAPSAPVVPVTINLSGQCPPVYDQGALGSCTANAIGAALEFDQRKQNASWDFLPSRLFIYYNERSMEGSINSDAGAQIRDGIKSINTLGVCKEIMWPYNIKKFAKKPTTDAFKEATFHKALTYQRLDNTKLLDLQSCLANGLPFVFGFTVYDEFESAEVAHTGIIHLPSNTDSPIGGHAVMCVGYDSAKRMFLVRNSWGATWGLRGYFWMPFEYMTNPNLASDFWTIQTINSSNK